MKVKLFNKQNNHDLNLISMNVLNDLENLLKLSNSATGVLFLA